MASVISVRQLTKNFGEIKAVDDLSFEVNGGEVYGFLGQNGAGKSTTIRMLLSLIHPTSGSIELFGMNLAKHRKEILRQVGAIIERPDLYKYLSGLENLSLFARLAGCHLTRSQLMQQLAQVGLADRAYSKVKTYSQGMKQRLGIAVALVHNPHLIVLDEPSNGLDPQGIADVRQLILYLSKELHKTVFVSSHLLSEMELIATRLLIIDKGRKIIEGPAAALFHPDDTILEVRLQNGTFIQAALEQSAWRGALQKEETDRLLFRINTEKIPELVHDLIGMQAQILLVQPRRSLEDYFLSLTSLAQHVDLVKN